MTSAATHPLIPHYLDLLGADHGAGLRVGGHGVDALATQFGTPCYLYDAGVLRERYRAVVENLGVEVLFSIKANPSLAVAHVLRRAGAGTEVASAGELLIAERAGFERSRIQFAGPGKTRAELRLAVERGIGCINIESAAEYESIAGLATEIGQRPKLAIRVNPRRAVLAARLRMGGGSQKFGVDAERVAELAGRIVADRAVELQGLHGYSGTQCFDAAAWLRCAEELADLGDLIETETGITLACLDLGGGFGVPCFEGDPEFDLGAVGAGLQGLRGRNPGRRLFVELGRYLTAPAGIYVSRVLYVKASGGRRLAILDGGMHQHGAAAGVGAVLRRPFPIVAVGDPLGSGPRQTLGGPLCTPADEFGRDLVLPELRVGDLVAVLGSGAYGLSFSQSAFSGHPTPAEVLVDGDAVALCRARGRPQDVLRGQFLPGEA